MIECDKCRAKAAVYQRYSGMRLCPAHFKDDVHRKIRESIRETGVFAHKAHVAVALSGGKDSSVLLYALKDIFSKRKDIELIAVMIDEGIEGYSPKRLDFGRALARRLEVPYVIRRLGDVEMDGLNGLLSSTARELDADALATGHNLDDEASSILSSYLKGDIDGLFLLSPCRRTPDEVRTIKPLRRVPGEETALYAALHCPGHLDSGSRPCKGDVMRMEVRNVLNDFEARHPGTKYSMLRSLDRVLALRADSQQPSD
jgi:uncharacterized protein (TIGR00269 family)